MDGRGRTFREGPGIKKQMEKTAAPGGTAVCEGRFCLGMTGSAFPAKQNHRTQTQGDQSECAGLGDDTDITKAFPQTEFIHGVGGTSSNRENPKFHRKTGKSVLRGCCCCHAPRGRGCRGNSIRSIVRPSGYGWSIIRGKCIIDKRYLCQQEIIGIIRQVCGTIVVNEASRRPSRIG